MNKQGKLIDGKVVGGIEWVKKFLPDGGEQQGYTSNPIGGCQHGCRWNMPDGTEVICYAEETANGIASPAYPQGFTGHYWNPAEINAWQSLKKPSRIFVGSMTDMFGHWVMRDHRDQLDQVITGMATAHWHTYLLLTKNPRSILQGDLHLPQNCWIGASSPPDTINGQPMTRFQQENMLERFLYYLAQLRHEGYITWMSAEPLSWNIVPVLEDQIKSRLPIDWIVIGAASKGREYFPPREYDVKRLVELCDANGIKVFFKGNLSSLPWAKANWREEYPSGKFATSF